MSSGLDSPWSPSGTVFNDTGHCSLYIVLHNQVSHHNNRVLQAAIYIEGWGLQDNRPDYRFSVVARTLYTQCILYAEV